MIRAYGELTGALLWSHVEDAGGHDDVLALAVSELVSRSIAVAPYKDAAASGTLPETRFV